MKVQKQKRDAPLARHVAFFIIKQFSVSLMFCFFNESFQVQKASKEEETKTQNPRKKCEYPIKNKAVLGLC